MSEIPRHWRLKKERYSLVGGICKNGHLSFPHRSVCPDCRGEISVAAPTGGGGEIYSSEGILSHIRSLVPISSPKEASMSSK